MKNSKDETHKRRFEDQKACRSKMNSGIIIERQSKKYGSGFHIIEDLASLYHMIDDLDKHDNLFKEARKRLEQLGNDISKTARHFDISRKTFHE